MSGRIVSGPPSIYVGGELVPIESGSMTFALDDDGSRHHCGTRHTVWSGAVVLRYYCDADVGHDGEHRWSPE